MYACGDVQVNMCIVVWLHGCMGVWLYDRIVVEPNGVWAYGCMVVWLHRLYPRMAARVYGRVCCAHVLVYKWVNPRCMCVYMPMCLRVYLRTSMCYG